MRLGCLVAFVKLECTLLGCLGAEEPAFFQGALFDFRMRLLGTGMDQRLLERTVDLARRRGGFEAKSLRLALDSSPLWGRGRVEDTLNLLGHAAHQVIGGLAALAQQDVAHVIEQIGLSLFDAPRLKAALDIDGADADQKQQALQRLCDELDARQDWIGTHFPQERHSPPLAAALHTVQALRAPDREPDPAGGTRIRPGVANDRPISITDPERRHGRTSSSSRFDGDKRHIAQDLDEGVILAAEVLPANRPDTAGLEPLLIAVERQQRQVTALPIDRGYLGDDLIPDYEAYGAAIARSALAGSPPGRAVRQAGISPRPDRRSGDRPGRPGDAELGRSRVGVAAVEDDRDLIAGGQAIVRRVARTGGTVVQIALLER